MLKKATSYLNFFAKMDAMEVYKERRVHRKCCQKMLHQIAKKGEVVIKEGDAADKFFVTISGMVHIFIPKTKISISDETDIIEKLISFLKRTLYKNPMVGLKKIKPAIYCTEENGFHEEERKIVRNWKYCKFIDFFTFFQMFLTKFAMMTKMKIISKEKLFIKKITYLES